MDFSVKQTKDKYFLYVKMGKNRFFRSNRPLLVTYIPDLRRIDLSHLRDVDLSISVKEGEKIEFGIIKVKNSHLKEYPQIREKEDIEKNSGMEIVFEENGVIHMVNERQVFQGNIRAEIYIKGDGYKIRWNVWKMQKEYVMSNPSIEIDKMEWMEKIE